MNLLRNLRKSPWLLALCVVAVLVHLSAGAVMARGMGGEFPNLGGAICISGGAPDAAPVAPPVPETPPAGVHLSGCCDLCGICNAPVLSQAEADTLRSPISTTPERLTDATVAVRLVSPYSPLNPRGPPRHS